MARVLRDDRFEDVVSELFLYRDPLLARYRRGSERSLPPIWPTSSLCQIPHIKALICVNFPALKGLCPGSPKTGPTFQSNPREPAPARGMLRALFIGRHGGWHPVLHQQVASSPSL